jgi:spermidine synthase
MTERRRDAVLLFLVGIDLMLLNYVLIRQLTLSFAHPETAALLTGIAYFVGVSIGYARPALATRERVRRVLPAFLLFQVSLMIGGPAIVQVVAGSLGPWIAYATVFALTALGSTSLFSVFLPNAIGEQGEQTAPLYSVEIAGSLVAIALLPLLSHIGPRAVQAAYFAAFVGITVLLRGRLILVAAIAVAALIGFDAADKWVAAATYKRMSGASSMRVVATRMTPYHKIEIVDALPGGRMLVLDGKLQFDASMHDNYSYFVAEYPARLLGRPQTCVLGCGSMSTIGRIGEVAESIQIVDIDRGVFEASKEYFRTFNRLGELSNWSFLDDDAKHFLATTDRSFDLIIDDIPPAKSRQVALTYTREFFRLVAARLSARGVFSLPTLVSVGSRESDYGRRILATLASVFEQVFVVDLDGASYCFATSRALAVDEATLRAAIEHPARDVARILLDAEARSLVAGLPPVTVGSMHDLMRD